MNKQQAALLVIAYTPYIADFLRENDPRALQQVADALHAPTTGLEVLEKEIIRLEGYASGMHDAHKDDPDLREYYLGEVEAYNKVLSKITEQKQRE